MFTATSAVPTVPVRRTSPWIRGAGAILAGLVANALLSTATDIALVAAQVFPPLSEFGRPASFSDSLLLLALAYRTLYGIFGCYLTARLAPHSPMGHALILGGIGVVIGTVGAIATWNEWTSWYSLAIIAVTLPSSWIGARLALTRSKPNQAR